MSIYDLPADSSDSSSQTPQPDPVAPTPTPLEPAPESAIANAGPGANDEPGTADGRPKRRRFGCGSCLLGCGGMLLVLLLIAGIGAGLVWSRWPGWARDTVARAVNESDLSDEDKQQVLEQLDRLQHGYEDQEIDAQQLLAVGEQVLLSPLFPIMMADSVHELYIKPSGLSPQEKQQADDTLLRVALGVFAERIDHEKLEGPLDHISHRDSNGERVLKTEVSDAELRTMLAECLTLANSAEVSAEELGVHVGDELERIVDHALAPSS